MVVSYDATRVGIGGHEQLIDRQLEVESLAALWTRNDAGHPVAEQQPAQVERQGLAVADRQVADSISVTGRPGRQPYDAPRQQPGEPRRRGIAGRLLRPVGEQELVAGRERANLDVAISNTVDPPAAGQGNTDRGLHRIAS